MESRMKATNRLLVIVDQGDERHAALARARWLARTIFDMRGAYYPHVLFAYEPPDPGK